MPSSHNLRTNEVLQVRRNLRSADQKQRRVILQPQHQQLRHERVEELFDPRNHVISDGE